MNNLTRALILAFFAMSLVACAMTPPSSAKKAVSTAATSLKHWDLVEKDPPTYFPKGFPANSSTTHKDGDWIYAGTNGEQWFVPKDGVKGFTSEQLYKEALTRKTKGQRAEESEIAFSEIVLSDITYDDTMEGAFKVAKASTLAAILSPPMALALVLDLAADEPAATEKVIDVYAELLD